MYKIAPILTRDKLKQDIEQLTYDEDSLDNLSTKAEQYVKSKQWLECLEILDKIADIYGVSSQLLVNKSLVYYWLGEIRAAIQCLEESLGLDLDNDHTLTLLGKFRDRLRDMKFYTMDPIK